MKIAMLISGRIARYESCLLPILNNSDYHEIHLFISVNDKHKDCKYYKDMKINLQKWLKFICIKEFIIDKEIFTIFNPNISIATHKLQVNLQKVNDKFVPNNALSMYYNDMITFNEACQYADNNGFEYDLYLKFRSDIIANDIPKHIIKPLPIEIHLYNHTPLCNFTSGGIYKKPIICDAYAWGNRNTMKIYCNTYNYVFNKTKLYNGTYYISFECSLTDNIYEHNVDHSFHYYGYRLDRNRRMFDNIMEDSRCPISNSTERNVDVNEFNKHIPADKQE